MLGPLFSLFATRYTARAVNIIGEGAFVVAEVLGDVETHRGDRYDNEYCFVFRFEGDRIAEVTEYCDTELIARVLGPYDQLVGPSAASSADEPASRKQTLPPGLTG